MNWFDSFPHQLHPIGAFGLIEQRCFTTGMRGDVCVTDDFGDLVSVDIPTTMMQFRD